MGRMIVMANDKVVRREIELVNTSVGKLGRSMERACFFEGG